MRVAKNKVQQRGQKDRQTDKLCFRLYDCWKRR